MEISPSLSQPQNPPKFHPNTDKIAEKLLEKGVHPTPKILHNIRKKEIQKHNRKQKRLPSPSSETQKQALTEDSYFDSLKQEYREFNKAVKSSSAKGNGGLMVGVPWERIERVKLRELSSRGEEFSGSKLKRENLRELGEMFEERKREELQWLLDDDVELEGNLFDGEGSSWAPVKRKRTEDETVGFLVKRLGAKEIEWKDWKFSRMMKLSGLQFTEKQLLKILKGLGNNGHWKQAISVVKWVYHDKERKRLRSRFVYTKLLSVLGNARRTQEALDVFNLMREDFYLYPDMAAYHSIAVTLGQSGLVRELMNIVECMRQKPSKKMPNLRRKNWDPVLEPDLVVYNAVLNACVASQQWKGVSWVFEQIRKSGLKPSGATYGLAMEVMLRCGKYDLVHDLFQKMKRSGEALRAITYKVVVRAFWEEGKVDEAVSAVREMECRGVVGIAGVYYELACCLCNSGRWQEAVLEVEKLRKLPHTKPLEVTFTGLIMSSLEGGHFADCLSIFDYMRGLCAPNIGTINTVLKVYERNDMFPNAKELFEGLKGTRSFSTKGPDCGNSLVPDEFTYWLMLRLSASALQWEYFEYIYKEMLLSGYKLDQDKLASLLVSASKAGKGYLLEHAFDDTLENGEVPHPLIFVERILQATIQHQYERVVTLTSATIHASFQLSERQWVDHLLENSDRISKECLQNFLAYLCKCDQSVLAEGPVGSLFRSLCSLCESGGSGEVLGLGDFSHGARTEHLIGGEEGTHANTVNGRSNPSDDNLMSSSTPIFHDQTRSDAEGGNGDGHRQPGKEGRNDMDTDIEEKFLNDTTSSEYSGFDNILSTFNSDGSLKELDEDETDLPANGSECCESNLPTAHEILEMWKRSRQKDGMFFPFQVSADQVSR